MELLLNTFWFVLAISAFLFWLSKEEVGGFHRLEHDTRCRFIVLACVLVLLFPVISLTDDLHAEQTPIEDSSRSVVKAQNLAQIDFKSSQSIFALAGPPALHLVKSRFNVVGLVTVAEWTVRSAAPASAHAGRSPPICA